MITMLAFRPFLDPLPIWRLPPWLWMPLMLIPLTAGVAIVYKSIKCRKMDMVAKEATTLTGLILLFMVVAAIVLAVLVRGLER
jgi:hypothetical protein